MVRLVQFRLVIVNANSRAEEGSGEESARASGFLFWRMAQSKMENSILTLDKIHPKVLQHIVQKFLFLFALRHARPYYY
jgi:hypothetical protein